MLTATQREQSPTKDRLRVPDESPPVDLPNGITLFPMRERWTLDGREFFREAPVHVGVEEKMKTLWREHREAFVRRGFSLQQHNEKWFLSQWLREITVRDSGKPVQAWELTKLGQTTLNDLLAPEELALQFDKAIQEMDALPDWLEALLYDYQVQPARQLFRSVTHGAQEWGYPGAWDASELGTGKTYTSTAAAVATGLEIGIICPISTMVGWRAACSHFGVKPRFMLNYEALRTGRRDYLRIEKYDTGVRGPTGKITLGRRFAWTLDPCKTILLYDEAHNLKNTSTRNQAIAIASLRQLFPTIFMSGTLAKDPTQMRATGRAVGLHKGGTSWTQFLGVNGCTAKSKTPKFCGGKRGRAILATLHHKIFPMRGARIRIADLGDRFPETQIINETFETEDASKIAAEWERAEAILRQLEKQGASLGKIQNMRFEAYLRAWQNSERLKVPTIKEMVHDELEEGRHVAVFVSFSETRLSLMKEFDTQCGIYGGQPAHMRDHWITEFQADRQAVMINQIDAGGVGVNLHDVRGEFPRTSIILPSTKVISVKQALGRVHRAGGMSRSRQIILFAAGTLEERMCKALRAQLGQIAALNDGDLMPMTEF